MIFLYVQVIMRSAHTNPLGLLGCVSSLRQQPLILEELLEGAQQFDLELIRYTSLLGAEERRLCLEIAGSPLSLRHLSRVCIRHVSSVGLPSELIMIFNWCIVVCSLQKGNIYR